MQNANNNEPSQSEYKGFVALKSVKEGMPCTLVDLRNDHLKTLFSAMRAYYLMWVEMRVRMNNAADGDKKDKNTKYFAFMAHHRIEETGIDLLALTVDSEIYSKVMGKLAFVGYESIKGPDDYEVFWFKVADSSEEMNRGIYNLYAIRHR